MKIKDNLTGKRITVRSYRKSDIDFVGSIWFDKENGKYLSDPEREYIDEKFQKAVDGLEDTEFGYYFIAEKNDTGEPVGTCSVFPEKDKDGCCVYDIGYCVHKDRWRQGLGSEMVSLLLDWIKSQGGTKVTAEAAKDNTASCEMLKKLGFEVIRESSFKKYNMGICFNSYIFGKTLK